MVTQVLMFIGDRSPVVINNHISIFKIFTNSLRSVFFVACVAAGRVTKPGYFFVKYLFFNVIQAYGSERALIIHVAI